MVGKLGKLIMAMLGLRILYPFFGWVIWKIGSASPSGDSISGDEFESMLNTNRVVHGIITGLDGLLTFSIFVLFVFFIFKIVSGVRASGGETKFSPVVSLLAWFIPIANAILPAIVVRDAWRQKVSGDQGGAVVWVWWLLYLLFMSTSTMFIIGDTLLYFPEVTYEIGEFLAPAVRWGYWPKLLIEWGFLASWIAVVRGLTQASSDD